MKKWLLVFSLCFTLVSIKTITVCADDYRIDKFYETIAIDNAGDAQINYDLTYQFDATKHGFFINQTLGQKQAISQPITAIVNGEKLSGYRANSNRGLEILKENANQVFKLHYPIEADQTYRMQLTYKIKNFIKRYRDVAVINQAIIGDNWDVDLGNVDIKILLPNRMQKQFAVYTHSFTEAKFIGDANTGQYRLQASAIDANTQIELHAYFDQNSVPLAPQSKQNMATKITQQEQALRIKRQKAIAKRTTLKKITYLFFVVAVIILLFGNVYRFRRQQRALVNNAKINSYDLPSDLRPAIVAAQLQARNLNVNNAFNATLMDLIARKYLKIDSTKPFSKQKSQKANAKLMKIVFNKVTDELSDFELKVLNVLFGDLHNLQVGMSVAVKDFSNNESTVAKRYQKNITKFKTQVITAAQQHQLIDVQADAKFGGINILAALVATLGTIWHGFLIFSNQFSNPTISELGVFALLVIVTGGIYVYAFRAPKIYLASQWQVAQDWGNFRRMLKNIGEFDVKQVTDVILWDRYLAYAIALGVGQEASKALAKYLPDNQQLNLADGVGLYVVFSMLNANSNGNGVFSSNFSSSGGSLGGFSSGGSGSGSGGGAF